MNYYNEFDPKIAAWLRQLIADGHIPAGEVDERSIEDVKPGDLRGFVQCHFFAGIGGWSHALDLAGWPRDQRVWTGSCPCQPFSAAGQSAGFADERHLWPAWQHLIAQCRPPIVFGEQVASKAADVWVDLVHTDMENMGYAFGCVPFPSAGVGAPHIRDRNYWLAHAHDTRLEGRQAAAERAIERPAWPGVLVGGLANAASLGRIGRRSSEAGNEPGTVERLERLCDAGRLADPDGGHASAEREQRSGQQRQQPQDGGACDVADTTSEGSSHGGARNPQPITTPIDGSNRAAWPGPVNGQWRDADWLGCTDGKWRPVEPGTFPLAHGIPARMVRLRGYGNAINPHQAAEFIRASVEVIAA